MTTTTITHHTTSSTTTIRQGDRLIYDGAEPDGVEGAERTANLCRLLGDTVELVVEP